MNIVRAVFLACCGLAVSSSIAVAKRKDLVVAIKCPADNGGILEIYEQSAEGHRGRIVMDYNEGKTSYVINYFALPGEADYSRLFDCNFVTSDLLTDKSFAHSRDVVAAFADAYREFGVKSLLHFCLSEPEEKRFGREEIEANRKLLGLK